MKDIEVGANVSRIQARVEWSGTGLVQLMVNPVGATPAEAHEFTAPGPDQFAIAGPLCVDVPSEHLKAGMWEFMLHTAAGADIQYTINVTIEGTAKPPAEHHSHWFTSTEYLTYRVTQRVPQTAAPCSPTPFSVRT